MVEDAGNILHNVNGYSLLRWSGVLASERCRTRIEELNVGSNQMQRFQSRFTFFGAFAAARPLIGSRKMPTLHVARGQATSQCIQITGLMPGVNYG
jgi:hypothetical protein